MTARDSLDDLMPQLMDVYLAVMTNTRPESSLGGARRHPEEDLVRRHKAAWDSARNSSSVRDRFPDVAPPDEAVVELGLFAAVVNNEDGDYEWEEIYIALYRQASAAHRGGDLADTTHLALLIHRYLWERLPSDHQGLLEHADKAYESIRQSMAEGGA